MAAGTDGLQNFTLIGGKVVSLNVNLIASIEELTNKETKSKSIKKYGSSGGRYTGTIAKVVMSNGKAYLTINTEGVGTKSSFTSAVTDTKTTIAESPKISGGKF